MKKLFWNKHTYTVLIVILTQSCTDATNTNFSLPDNKVEPVNTLPYYNEASFEPNWIINEDSLVGFHQIRPFQLIDQKGNTFSEKELEGKIYVADFFFATCGGICPKMTSNMALIQDAFIDDPNVLLVSHSVTPTNDTPEVLNAYGERNKVLYDKWRLLTGERSEIYDLGRNYYFVEESLGLEKSEDDFLHTENFVLIDQNRRIRGIYNGINKTSVNYLITDIKTLLEN